VEFIQCPLASPVSFRARVKSFASSEFAGTLCIRAGDNCRDPVIQFPAGDFQQLCETNRGIGAALVTLLLLLSSMPSSYHYSVLIFTALVGIDELLKIEDKRRALAFVLLLTRPGTYRWVLGHTHPGQFSRNHVCSMEPDNLSQFWVGSLLLQGPSAGPRQYP
jgi:hypothetical protein